MKVELKNISKKYEGNSFYTLENINLAIEDKDFCVLLGPSGCGKTTLLRIIAGLNYITKGDLLFDGKKANNLLPKDRDIAMVFQSYALYPHYTVYKNMSFGLKLKREKKEVINYRVRAAAKMLKIEKYLFKKPRELSGGQQQRVALGRAIVKKPKLFLMDEPLSNLDAKLRETMRTELVTIHNMLETTTIYVTHDQLEAMSMATKIVLMNEQVIQQVGKAEELYNKPANLFAAKFIGSPTINIVTGDFKEGYFINEQFKIKFKLSDSQIKNINHNQIEHLAIGIRSEDIKLEEKTPDIILKLRNKESLGINTQLTFEYEEDKNFIVTIENFANIQQLGKDYGLKINKYHLFDAVTEKRID
ncbi:multiple sugar transport system ATP-binding protein [Spiroplasma litorale]|uniref:Multiple sugar transport system ATP-binding protein n=1 Tax=Spiroplasma litorale TaxID=216942 RepID=A0A0K1W296_9MOLU|nr:ABC transporter ATP-binding protein [Spiroplasma litorale]AKX34291.1 multiple sugar transport system ATP-binding protein [Spiroplasma litorale]